jgi:hypothetical protein
MPQLSRTPHVQHRMKTYTKQFALALTAGLLLVGCATSLRPTTVYEYRVIQGVTDAREFEEKLDKAGSEGFTIVSSSLIPKEVNVRQQAMVILKRVKR